MKKELEKKIIQSHKEEQLVTAIPHHIVTRFNLNRYPKTKDLPQEEKDKLVREAVLRRKRNQEKKLKDISFEDIQKDLSIDELIKYHLEHNDTLKFKTLLVLYKFLELQDENKMLTLTDEQYKAWLQTSNLNQYITTKQFSILYGLSANQQKGLRQKITDPLLHLKLNETSNILYNRLEVEKWLENYKGKMKI